MNNELQLNDEIILKTVNSRDVADMMGVRHDTILRKIGRILETLTEGTLSLSDYFILSSYFDSTGRELKCYEITLDGIDLMVQNSRKTNKIKTLVNYLNENGYYSKNVICVNRFELSFGQALIETLKPLNIKIETQKPTLGKYRIDFYLPEYRLAIEYDEKEHKYNVEEDLKRQIEIEKELNCKFIRLDYKNNDNYNVGIVLKELFSSNLLAS
ncbi:TPA: Rha family transcriptional regulator [Clostridium perfringens]|nr:Rha family transcriptional regulator [Clostridium perfringens]